MNIFSIGSCRVKNFTNFPEGYNFQFLKNHLHNSEEINQFFDFANKFINIVQTGDCFNVKAKQRLSIRLS